MQNAVASVKWLWFCLFLCYLGRRGSKTVVVFKFRLNCFKKQNLDGNLDRLFLIIVIFGHA